MANRNRKRLVDVITAVSQVIQRANYHEKDVHISSANGNHSSISWAGQVNTKHDCSERNNVFLCWPRLLYVVVCILFGN